MNPSLVLTRLLVVTSGVLLGFSGTLIASEPAREETLELPKYTVTTGRELPPPELWHYARIAGFEVLSSAPERATRKLVGDFQDFAYAIDLVWPGLRPPAGPPTALIICGRSAQFDQFLPARLHPGEQVATSYHAGDQAALVLDVQNKLLSFRIDNVTTPTTDTNSQSYLAAGLAVDSYQQLFREYVRFRLSREANQPPPWLAEGLTQLLMNLHITETEISVGRIDDPNGGGLKPALSDFNEALGKRHLMPIGEMFAGPKNGSAEASVLEFSWTKQCYAFVHWGLYGDYGRHQKEFLTFVHRLGREAPSEALFKECFKQDYQAMEQSLRSHIEFTRFKFAGVRADKGQKIPWPPAAEVRDATQAEVGRLKGAAHALAGHPAEAHGVLLDAYLRGEREPALLGSLGVAEAASGDPVKARKLLEAATAAKVERPRAYVELARLRLEAARAQPEAATGKLSARQTASVLEPLFTARSLPPALPETYELIAAAWAACISTPGQAQLAVLDEGVRLFPRDAALVYADAELQAKAGQIATAESLIRHGLRVTADADLLARFEHLRAGLPPVPAPAKG